jgi:FkbM family methyltransferase
MSIISTFDPYFDVKIRAKRVYESLFDELSNARQIYVGGITAPGGHDLLGESRFLCTLFDDLIFVDDYRAGSTVHGREVVSTKQFASSASSADFLINNCQSVAGFNHFDRQADSLNLPSCSTIEALTAFYKNGWQVNYSGMFAVYGPAFHEHTYNNLDIYRNIRGCFVDQLSERTLSDLIRYRLSGNPNYLHRVAVGRNYGRIQHDSYMLNSQFITLTEDEVFIDAGALVGDSSEYFIRSVRGNFKRIVLFEPNPQSVTECEARLQSLDREFVHKHVRDKSEIIPKGLYGFSGELEFTTSLFDADITAAHGVLPQSGHILETGLSSPFSAKGQEFGVIKVPVTTLDEVLSGDPATFIKFEIEGSEVDALHGAEKTIRAHRPKLALSVYHRPQDIELIIQFVQNLNMDYRMALRAHTPEVPDAIVLYCW